MKPWQLVTSLVPTDSLKACTRSPRLSAWRIFSLDMTMMVSATRMRIFEPSYMRVSHTLKAVSVGKTSAKRHINHLVRTNSQGIERPFTCSDTSGIFTLKPFSTSIGFFFRFQRSARVGQWFKHLNWIITHPDVLGALRFFVLTIEIRDGHIEDRCCDRFPLLCLRLSQIMFHDALVENQQYMGHIESCYVMYLITL